MENCWRRFLSPSQSQETTKAATTETVTADEIRSEISEAFDAIGTYSVQQRDEAMARAEETLAEVDAEIDQLEDTTWENWNEMSQAAKNKSAAALKDLRRRRNKLSERYGALKHGADSAWEDLKGGFSDAWNDLKAAWQDADDAARKGNK